MEYLMQSGIMAGEANLLAIVAILFVAGLLGSLTHCVGMCGPFVMAQVSAPPDLGPSNSTKAAISFKRLSGMSLIPYHLGRMTTYVGIGVIAAIFSNSIMAMTEAKTIAAILLVIAAAIFIVNGLQKGRSIIAFPFLAGMGKIAEMLSTPFRQKSNGWHRYGLGVALGFLPCGFLFAAISAVASTGSPIPAALGMTAFVIGTAPALMLTAFGGHLSAAKWPKATQIFIQLLTFINGLALLTLAWHLIQ